MTLLNLIFINDKSVEKRNELSKYLGIREISHLFYAFSSDLANGEQIRRVDNVLYVRDTSTTLVFLFEYLAKENFTHIVVNFMTTFIVYDDLLTKYKSFEYAGRNMMNYFPRKISFFTKELIILSKPVLLEIVAKKQEIANYNIPSDDIALGLFLSDKKHDMFQTVRIYTDQVYLEIKLQNIMQSRESDLSKSGTALLVGNPDYHTSVISAYTEALSRKFKTVIYSEVPCPENFIKMCNIDENFQIGNPSIKINYKKFTTENYLYSGSYSGLVQALYVMKATLLTEGKRGRLFIKEDCEDLYHEIKSFVGQQEYIVDVSLYIEGVPISRNLSEVNWKGREGNFISKLCTEYNIPKIEGMTWLQSQSSEEVILDMQYARYINLSNLRYETKPMVAGDQYSAIANAGMIITNNADHISVALAMGKDVIAEITTSDFEFDNIGWVNSSSKNNGKQLLTKSGLMEEIYFLNYATDTSLEYGKSLFSILKLNNTVLYHYTENLGFEHIEGKKIIVNYDSKKSIPTNASLVIYHKTKPETAAVTIRASELLPPLQENIDYANIEKLIFNLNQELKLFLLYKQRNVPIIGVIGKHDYEAVVARIAQTYEKAIIKILATHDLKIKPPKAGIKINITAEKLSQENYLYFMNHNTLNLCGEGTDINLAISSGAALACGEEFPIVHSSGNDIANNFPEIVDYWKTTKYLETFSNKNLIEQINELI